MRDPDFTVTGVTEADVIHASKSDLPRIFRITTSQIHGILPASGINTTGSTSSNGSAASDGPVSRQYTLLMADNHEVCYNGVHTIHRCVLQLTADKILKQMHSQVIQYLVKLAFTDFFYCRVSVFTIV